MSWEDDNELVQAGRAAIDEQAAMEESFSYREVETGSLQIMYYNRTMVQGHEDAHAALAIREALARRGWRVDQETPRHNPTWTYTRSE